MIPEGTIETGGKATTWVVCPPALLMPQAIKAPAMLHALSKVWHGSLSVRLTFLCLSHLAAEPKVQDGVFKIKIPIPLFYYLSLDKRRLDAGYV